MSSLIVPVTTILEILPHPNADRLEIARVYDWLIVVQRERYQVGDATVYVPIDSVLDGKLEEQLFPPDSKITLNKSRVRSIKIRSHVSQGMLMSTADVVEFTGQPLPPIGTDMAEALGITKYEPPAPRSQLMRGRQAPKRLRNLHFIRYTEIENLKWYPELFEDGEEVYVSEKLHGTSFRAGWLPTDANTWLKKLKRKLRILPAWEFCWGSRNVQIQQGGVIGRTKKRWTKQIGYRNAEAGVDFGDVYSKMVKQYDLRMTIPQGYVVYGEIVGAGIQKGYEYGHKANAHTLHMYDIMVVSEEEKEYLSYHEFKYAWDVHLSHVPLVPELHVGPYEKDKVLALKEGKTTLNGKEIREGVVIKPTVEQNSRAGRKVLKAINDAYLLKEQSDWH